MSRPALDGPRGARYLSPALVAAPVTARVVMRHRPTSDRERAYVAAKLATGFRTGHASDTPEAAAVEAVRRAAVDAAADLAATLDSRTMASCIDAALALQSRILAAPDGVRASLGVAVVRALIEADRHRCVTLDRAVRDAARLHAHHVTAAQERDAAVIVAEVLP